jgi:hypothetical protein
MFDQDDLNNLGRVLQLKEQEKTTNAILNQQNKEASMLKCPWCAGPVENNVSKCRHCTSDIEWVNITMLEPCKPENKEHIISRQNEEYRVQNLKTRCAKCNWPVNRMDVSDNGQCPSCAKPPSLWVTLPLVSLIGVGVFCLVAGIFWLFD